jgi:drug/metabolite transporter (DMT)-like permease
MKRGTLITHLREHGVAAALGAAALFGISTPLSKFLLGDVSPWLLAGLLYMGAGLGLTVLRLIGGQPIPRLRSSEIGWLAGATVTGGIVAPVLLMYGLSDTAASGASLLLNAEAVFTALIAWFVFRENFDRRIALGMALIVAGALVLAWLGQAEFTYSLPAAAVLGACMFWAIDNNFTRKISLTDATFIVMVKGLVAGTVNLLLALAAGASFPLPSTMLTAGLVGFVSYGASLLLFVVALRHLGTARTGAYFSTAPFVGALVSIVALGEPVTVTLAIAGLLMGAGVWLHLTEHHAHRHTHQPLEHEHEHLHDEHHQHEHEHPVAAGTRHTHWHRHDPVTHSHPHYPDAHHRHEH